MPPSPAFTRSVRRRRSRDAGFSLLELAVVVFILSVVAALAVPAFKQATLEARAAAVTNDLRVFSGALAAYAQENGDWPAGTGEPGVIPAGLEGALRSTNWTHPSPVGGLYTWTPHTVQQGERYRAAITLASTPASPVSTDRIQLTLLDRKLDDGNLDSGNLRLGFRNYPVFVLEH